ncbi:50S ribosomal protein L13 [Citrus sinensis]|uniref:50S ribosomal protein L13 n=1 Tax=Citrus sinensis TaxID=2711 RepID=A0ACB8M7A3_CITSI|nr:50S ribosomal protein L13 [Citrus sinensis]
MATLCTPTCVIFSSLQSSSSSSSFKTLNTGTTISSSTTPFLGFSVASAKSTSPLNTKRSFKVRCCQNLSLVPDNQRWMFEQSEVNGPDIWNNTWYPKAADHRHSDKTWYVVDATDKILGRLASTIAIHIRGKNLATYTPSVDMGAYVIVVCGTFGSGMTGVSFFIDKNMEITLKGKKFKVNAEKVAVSGKKRTQKIYRRHSGRPGGMKEETFDQLQHRIPERIIEHAVRGMLPKGRLGRELFTHLKVYKGPNHPHEAQQPIELPIRDKRIQKQR